MTLSKETIETFVQLPLPDEFLPKEFKSTRVVDPRKLPLDHCDKCGELVPPFNDAVRVELIKTGNSWVAFGSQARHFLPTYGCQGSPSRAQYIEGQPKDKRGFSYEDEQEIFWRAAYAVVRAEEGGDPLNKKDLKNIAEALYSYAKKLNQLTEELDEAKQDREFYRSRARIELPSRSISSSPRSEIRRRQPRGHSVSVEINNQLRRLSEIDTKVLQVLLQRKGEVVSKQDFTTQVWAGDTTRSNVAMAIMNLRLAIEPDPKTPVYIHTVRGQGYKLLDPDNKIVLQTEPSS